MSPVRNLTARSISLLAVTALIATGCGGSSSTEPTPLNQSLKIADLVGSWTATSMTFTNASNPGEVFDVIAAGGEFRVTMLNGGGTRHWLEIGTFSDEWDALLTLNGNVLTSVPAESSRPTRQHSVTLENGVLTLIRSNASFDFTLSGGQEVPATEKTVMIRH